MEDQALGTLALSGSFQNQFAVKSETGKNSSAHVHGRVQGQAGWALRSLPNHSGISCFSTKIQGVFLLLSLNSVLNKQGREQLLHSRRDSRQ